MVRGTAKSMLLLNKALHSPEFKHIKLDTKRFRLSVQITDSSGVAKTVMTVMLPTSRNRNIKTNIRTMIPNLSRISNSAYKDSLQNFVIKMAGVGGICAGKIYGNAAYKDSIQNFVIKMAGVGGIYAGKICGSAFGTAICSNIGMINNGVVNEVTEKTTNTMVSEFVEELTDVPIDSNTVVNVLENGISQEAIEKATNASGIWTARYAGKVGGATIGNAIYPGVGAMVGGFIGGVSSGMAVSVVTRAIAGKFKRDVGKSNSKSNPNLIKKQSTKKNVVKM